MAVAESFVESGAWVSVLALAEAVWGLDSVFARTPEEQARAVEMLLGHERLVLQDSDTVADALPALGFSDYLIFELARKAGHLPLGTFDKGLARIAGSQKL